MSVFSFFVVDNNELLTLIPGIIKWRIDEARKHAFLNEPGKQIQPPQIKRRRLHPAKVDHFLDFVSSPSFFLQDVVYGTKKLKLSDGDTLEIPNVVRTVIASVIAFKQYNCLNCTLPRLDFNLWVDRRCLIYGR